MSGRWQVDHHAADAATLHALDIPEDGRPRIWVFEVTRPAVVLGSTQDEAVVDHGAARAAGVDVVRRRSGGGAVWVAPGDPLWIDVIVPRGHRLWDEDVQRSFLPIGRAWQRALAAVGIADTSVHEGRFVRTAWSSLVCFAGLGPGEVHAGEAKVVGISQRRSRWGARFQCAVPVRWAPSLLVDLLVPSIPHGVVAAAGRDLDPTVGAEQLRGAFVEALTTVDHY